MAIHTLLPGIKKNIPLKNYTSFKIGGKSRYFFVAKNRKALIKVTNWAKKNNLPFFVLGGGSNLLVSDKGYKGLVIKIQNQKFKIQNYSVNPKVKIINAESGARISDLVRLGSLTGFEWAIGIPGTIGGAIFGNAGAFGKSIGDNVKEVEAYDVKANKVVKLSKAACSFSYRSSIFSAKRSLIILSVVLVLDKGNKKEIKEKMKKYLELKKEKQPLNYPSAGSVFKNPKNYTAAELINKCGLQGKRIGGAEISKKHANFIVNTGNAKSENVEELINIAKKEVKNKFKIILEEEVQYL